ncbi:hypothetical protein EVA_03394 [gut metagenome]|uniref:Uncharacterized protein n=1 Tax=gut metagenome TaxID=749906 RepID=J9H439_9ZZZZ
MTNPSSTLHQLHLFFVLLHNGTVGVGIAIETNHKTIGEGSYLMIVTDTRHRTSGRNNIAEMVKQLKDSLR